MSILALEGSEERWMRVARQKVRGEEERVGAHCQREVKAAFFWIKGSKGCIMAMIAQSFPNTNGAHACTCCRCVPPL